MPSMHNIVRGWNAVWQQEAQSQLMGQDALQEGQASARPCCHRVLSIFSYVQMEPGVYMPGCSHEAVEACKDWKAETC